MNPMIISLDKELSSRQPMSLLCKAIIHSTELSDSLPVIITTQLEAPVIVNGQAVRQALNNHNEGWIYFPSVKEFTFCAFEAIRCHNPHGKALTLRDCWHQAILHGIADN